MEFFRGIGLECGKSTLLRELIWKGDKSSYVTLDKSIYRDSADLNPEAFLSQFQIEPIIIDEAQKAPRIFDEIKALVDTDKRPGRFVLSGSVQFSKKTGIRESLTGRAGSFYLDSLFLSETLSSKASPSLPELQRYLKRGGMPGVCFLRDESQIQTYWDG